MLERPELAVVIPAFNEASTIVKVVKSIIPYGQPVVVDDCSSDETGYLAESNGAIVIRHHTNLGYEEALNSGFAEAERRGYLYIVTFDADGQHDAALINQFASHLKAGYELVMGVRPRYARFAEKVFGLYTKARFGLIDPLCGMKGYRTSVYCERGKFDTYKSVGTELALYGLLKKKSMIQVGIPIAERRGSPRFGQYWYANYRILRAMVLSILNLTSR